MKRSDLTEFSVEEEAFKLKIKRDTGLQAQPQVVTYATPTAATVPAPAPLADVATSPAPAPIADNATYITSPMVGTFYSAPSPESPVFAKAGDSVQEDSIVCIIEAMKIMNEIQSEKKGTIAEVLVENGQPIEYGQKLFRLA